MIESGFESFRAVCARSPFVRLAGAHNPLSGVLAAEAGFDALWASSFEISAVQCVPDAEILPMSHQLEVASRIQRSVAKPVVADCDTGYGGLLNVGYMVREFEQQGITAVCLEDQVSPKLNSFAAGEHVLVTAAEFVRKIEVAKRAQRSAEFFVIARTEALIVGLPVDEAISRCSAYAEAGADAVLVHSRAATNAQITEFLRTWDGRVPVFIVPTTYPDWPAAEIAAAGVAGVIYANYGVRATIKALRAVYREIYELGTAKNADETVASIGDVFDLQRLKAWQDLTS